MLTRTDSELARMLTKLSLIAAMEGGPCEKQRPPFFAQRKLSIVLYDSILTIIGNGSHAFIGRPGAPWHIDGHAVNPATLSIISRGIPMFPRNSNVRVIEARRCTSKELYAMIFIPLSICPGTEFHVSEDVTIRVVAVAY